MVKDPFSEWSVALDKLKVLSNEFSSNVHETEDFSRQLAEHITKVRNTLTFVICSEKSGIALERYLNYQVDLLSGILGANTGEPGDSSGKRQIFERSVCELIDFVGDHFSSYHSGAAQMSPVYRKYFIKTFSVDRQQITSRLTSSDLDALLKNALCEYLNETAENIVATLTMRELHYYRSVIREFSPLISLSDDEKLSDFVVNKCYGLEFNHFAVFVCLQEKIRGSYNRQPKRLRRIMIDRQLDFLQYKAKGDVGRYDQRWPSLSTMLLDWLKTEKFQMEQARLKSSVMSDSLFKLPFQLPVSHIAFLVRLLYKANVFGSVQLTEIFNFFTTHISSKRQQNLSPGAFSKDYYTKDMVTAVEVRHLLSRMIAEINRDYFPVWAVVCAAIFYSLGR